MQLMEILKGIWSILKRTIVFIMNCFMFAYITLIQLLVFSLIGSEPFKISPPGWDLMDKYLVYFFTFYFPFIFSYWFLSNTFTERSFKFTALSLYCLFTLFLTADNIYWGNGIEPNAFYIDRIFYFVPPILIILMELLKSYKRLILDLSKKT